MGDGGLRPLDFILELDKECACLIFVRISTFAFFKIFSLSMHFHPQSKFYLYLVQSILE